MAGDPSKTQIMYGLAGERRLAEWEVPWLAGYEGSKPVRVGNGAHDQRQLDVYGEMADALFQARKAGLAPLDDGWRVMRKLLEWLGENWREPDEGIWEVRGPRQQFVHSKVLAWVAFDRAVKAVEQFGRDGPDSTSGRRPATRSTARSARRGSTRSGTPSRSTTVPRPSTRARWSSRWSASCRPTTRGWWARPRPSARDLMNDGFIARYDTAETEDGLPPGEGAFLPCTFWYADNLALQGRNDEAAQVFERLLALRNDVGLLSEEYDPVAKRLIGNFPQAFSHIGLITTALNLCRPGACPTTQRKT